MAPAFDLVSMATEIQRADETLGLVTAGKLKVVLDQIRALKAQAESIVGRARRDAELHRAKCRFERRPGKLYHLYRRASEECKDGAPGRAVTAETYFSMLGPEDWSPPSNQTFLGSYRLELDMSWTPAFEVEERDEEDAVVRGVLLGAGPKTR
jgi:hypothetical protein